MDACRFLFLSCSVLDLMIEYLGSRSRIICTQIPIIQFPSSRSIRLGQHIRICVPFEGPCKAGTYDRRKRQRPLYRALQMDCHGQETNVLSFLTNFGQKTYILGKFSRSWRFQGAPGAWQDLFPPIMVSLRLHGADTQSKTLEGFFSVHGIRGPFKRE